jgi:ankyrin repeat protein
LFWPGILPSAYFVQVGNVAAVRWLLYKANRRDIVNAKVKPNGVTPLHIATAMNEHEIFEMLFEAGADPFTADNNGISSYAMAILRGDPRIIKILVDRDPESINHPIPASNQRLVKPIMLAIEGENSQEILRLLIRNGGTVDGRDNDGNTPLMKAIQDGRNTEVIQTLLERGANPDAQNDHQDAALIFAIKANSKAVFDLLLDRPGKRDVNTKNNDNETALYLVATLPSQAMVQALIDKGAEWTEPSGKHPQDI